MPPDVPADETSFRSRRPRRLIINPARRRVAP
jgi:hypothetical protein